MTPEEALALRRNEVAQSLYHQQYAALTTRGKAIVDDVIASVTDPE